MNARSAAGVLTLPMGRRLLAAAVLALLWGAFSSAPADAQTVIAGRILDDVEDRPIAGATIELIDQSGRVRGRTVSDATGSYRMTLRLNREEWLRLTAQRMGYATTHTPPFRFRPGEEVQTEIRLLTEAVLLAPLTVVTRRSILAPGLESFELRSRQALSGHFISRRQIEEARPFYLSDLLATVPGVRLGPSQGGGGRMVYMSRALPGEGGCPPQIFLDGRLMNSRVLSSVGQDHAGYEIVGFRTDPSVRIDEFVSVVSIHGIEVYSGMAGVPAEFYTPDARCGVIAIWTRTT